MTSILLVASEEANEGINQSLRMLPSVEFISTSEIFNKCTCSFKNDHLQIDIPIGLCELFSGRVVINNTFHIEKVTSTESPVWESFSPRWRHIVLKTLATKSLCSVFDYGPRGVSRSLMALPNQWYYASRLSSVIVPEYFYGFGGQNTPDWARQWLQKSVWSLFEWRQDDKLDSREKNWHRFLVQPVIGYPLIFAFLAGANEQLSITILNDKCQSPKILQKITNLARHISRFTKSLMGEVLVWVREDELVFGAYSPFMEMASVHPGFLAALITWCDNIQKYPPIICV